VSISGLILLSAVAGGVVWLLPRSRPGIVRWTALVASVVVFLAALMLWNQYDSGNSGMQLEENCVWIAALGVSYHVGVDGLSVFLILLTTFLTPLAVLISWNSITEKVAGFMAALLWLQAAMLGVFVALDLILFYVFWEAMLVPMYFIIGIWGGEQKLKATVIFVLYTMVGSVLMLVSMVSLALLCQPATGGLTFDLTAIDISVITLSQQLWLCLAFLLAFAIKVPLFPFHTWLPLAHVEAPTAGSVILAGVLLKTGSYAILRFCFPLFPEAIVVVAPYMQTLAVVGIIYGALVSFVQEDFKKLVAYSSVSHMGFIILGMFALNVEGVTGGVIQMVNHGVSTGGLFLCVGMLYERSHTRRFDELGGIGNTMPVYAGLFLIITLSSVGLPGLNGFVGEFLALAGAFAGSNPWFAVVGTSGVILAAVYLLWMYQRVVYGTEPGDLRQPWPDLNLRELVTLVPIVVMTVWIGLFPSSFLGVVEGSAEKLIKGVNAAQTEALDTDARLAESRMEPRR